MQKVAAPKYVINSTNPAVIQGLKLMAQAKKQKEKREKKEEKKVEKKTQIWAIDFDGTLTTGGAWPNIGKPNVNLIELLKLAHTMGVKLILWTSREGHYLDEAVEWCKDYGLEFDAVNDNVPETIQNTGQNPRKVIAHLFIDDRAFHFWGEEGERHLWGLIQKL